MKVASATTAAVVSTSGTSSAAVAAAAAAAASASASRWADTTWVCWESDHIMTVIGTAFLFPSVALLTAFIAVTLISRVASAKNLLAAAHGRVFVVEVGLNAALVLLFALNPYLDSWILIIGAAAAGVARFYLL
jgi:hypothetical protein